MNAVSQPEKYLLKAIHWIPPVYRVASPTHLIEPLVRSDDAIVFADREIMQRVLFDALSL
jgi:hypothetical protein